MTKQIRVSDDAYRWMKKEAKKKKKIKGRAYDAPELIDELIRHEEGIRKLKEDISKRVKENTIQNH